MQSPFKKTRSSATFVMQSREYPQTCASFLPILTNEDPEMEGVGSWHCPPNSDPSESGNQSLRGVRSLQGERSTSRMQSSGTWHLLNNKGRRIVVFGEDSTEKTPKTL